MQSGRLVHAFTPIAQKAVRWTGSPYAFILACLFVILWLASGPLLHFNATWNFIANTTTTLATFLVIFLLQHATNTGDTATHLKLDALLEADARDEDSQFVGIEDLTEPELAALKQAMREKAEQIRADRTRLNGGTQ